jgi:glycosyltransferase involved in cell wall biosynthesis
VAPEVAKILVVADFYLPGYKAGGPVRALENLARHLGHRLCFRLLTRDRDLGDVRPYEAILVDHWQEGEGMQIFYASPERLSLRKLARFVATVEHDVLYLNSFFSRISIRLLLLRRFGRIPRVPVILTPRGEFAPGALKIHSGRKRLYIAAARRFGLCRELVWQASSAHEAEDIRTLWGGGADGSRVVTTAELPSFTLDAAPPARSPKRAGRLSLIFLGRISRVKNLDGALRILAGVTGEIEMDIVGPVEDEGYWAECQRLIQELPANVRVYYVGSLDPARVPERLARADLFFLPTHGESYGHAIIESLAAGCPVLISNLTPWRDLVTEGAGWDISPSDERAFRDVLDTLCAADEETHAALSAGAFAYAQRCFDPDHVEQQFHLFQNMSTAGQVVTI